MPCYAGIDLAASPRRPTGVAIVCGGGGGRLGLESVGIAYSDHEILALIPAGRVLVAAVDAPLSLPPPGQGFRPVERRLLSMGGRLLPLSLEPMRKLAERAIRLQGLLEGKGVRVVETHPSTVLRLSGCGSHSRFYAAFGVEEPGGLSKHERDALVAALVAYCVEAGCGLEVREAGDTVYMVKPGTCISRP
ncbi:hypothetical protein CF15_00230 [Pyrodictium occultum]|uniref:DUF429 domain-containing protein n=1 Tax=Pyrodictium occultum TaxID=2309 RepID=A0A0V8RTM6_PYROC|nr:DUF429 domain-containing protein [Pyrodictium occultum]KSW11336.1 hypothetical protein CF15_00230 [Pyrodictium occultum]